MSNYLNSFIIEPVVRQARRLSRSAESNRAESQISPARPTPDHGDSWQSHEALAAARVAIAHGIPVSLMTEHGQVPIDTTISDRQALLSPTSDDGSLDGELGNLRHTATLARSPNPLTRQSRAQIEPDSSRQDVGHLEGETSNNPLYGIPSHMRSTTSSFSSMSSLNGTNIGPNHEITRSRGNSGEEPPQDQASFTNMDGDGSLPADDGMSLKRKRILAIQKLATSNEHKARLVHAVMTEQYNSSHVGVPRPHSPRSPSSISNTIQERPLTLLSDVSMKDPWHHPSAASSHTSMTDISSSYNITPNDLVPTYAPKPPRRSTNRPENNSSPQHADESDSDDEELPLGCPHYKRNVKLQCFTCKRWYTCRFCHDEVENHSLIRKSTINMLCMCCGCAQPVSNECIDCGEQGAVYYCSVCKLWDNDSTKSIYHCKDCGICRVGKGLGKDFYHCKTCSVCLSMSIRDTHRCIERSTDCDCPICGEYMFTSPQTVVVMRCGHSIHHKCYYKHAKSSYRCPICSRSMVNMETEFRRLDHAIVEQPMPEQFQDTKASVYCSDCCAKTTVKYHWLGLKCAACDSYNTAQIQILSGPDPGTLPAEEFDNPLTADAFESTEPPDPSLLNIRGRTLREGVPPPVRANTYAFAADQSARHVISEYIPQQTSRSVSASRVRKDPRTYPGVDGDSRDHTENEQDDDDDELTFWGGQSPRDIIMDEDGGGEKEEDEEEEDEEEYENDDDGGDGMVRMEGDFESDDDDDDDDIMAIIGHR